MVSIIYTPFNEFDKANVRPNNIDVFLKSYIFNIKYFLRCSRKNITDLIFSINDAT